MNDSVQKILVAVIAVVLMGAYVWWYTSGPSEPEHFPGGIISICQNPQCGHVFRITQKELTAHYKRTNGQELSCSKCGKTPVARGVECIHCKKITKWKRGEYKCPSCGQDLYDLKKTSQ